MLVDGRLQSFSHSFAKVAFQARVNIRRGKEAALSSHVTLRGYVYKDVIEKTSRNGKPFLLVKLRVDGCNATQWWNAIGWADDVRKTMLGLSCGDELYLAGEFSPLGQSLIVHVKSVSRVDLQKRSQGKSAKKAVRKVHRKKPRRKPHIQKGEPWHGGDKGKQYSEQTHAYRWTEHVS